MKLLDVKQLLLEKEDNISINVVGWVKFNRDSGKIGFIELNDGTSITNIQVVYKKETTKNFEEIKSFRTASAILIKGTLKNIPNKDTKEILADSIELLKNADQDYPLQTKRHSLEFLRENAHLRIRALTFQAIMKVRSELAFAIHKFFNENDFVWVATPVITSNDCEGAGENFVIQQDSENPFFGNKQASLTVSGQLNAESYAMGLKKVYTFGPTFRAEKSHTSRHLSEFWMVEPEMAFTTLPQLMLVIESMIKNVVQTVIEKCHEEFDFFKQEHPEIIERIDQLLNKSFNKIKYEDGIKILQEAIANGIVFEDNDIYFGKDLASEHERYLCEKHVNGPVFLYNFPKDIKAFYMKVNSDNITVAATDLLVPGVGEIIGGSQREDDYDVLLNRCSEMNIQTEPLQWYLDLRKYGYYSSSGFGLGFERFLMYICGIENIKDTIPFPRTAGEIKF